MELNDYQKQAMTTCTKSSHNFAYMFMNLVGEVGEFASKCAKFIRKEKATFRENNQFCPTKVEKQEREDLRKEELNISGNELTKPFAKFTSEDEVELRKEAGDILWQLSGLCSVMGWTLEEVAQENLAKLADRQKRNVIVGNGDNR